MIADIPQSEELELGSADPELRCEERYPFVAKNRVVFSLALLLLFRVASPASLTKIGHGIFSNVAASPLTWLLSMRANTERGHVKTRTGGRTPESIKGSHRWRPRISSSVPHHCELHARRRSRCSAAPSTSRLASYPRFLPFFILFLLWFRNGPTA